MLGRSIKKMKLVDFKTEIQRRNKESRIKIIKELDKYKNITLFKRSGVPTNGRYKYDFLWIDGKYKKTFFRICLYTQDIDLESLNVHIYHGNYTFQKGLVQNFNTIRSVFGRVPDVDLETLPKDDLEAYSKEFMRASFTTVMQNTAVSSFNMENLNAERLVKELLDFVGYYNDNPREEKYDKVSQEYLERLNRNHNSFNHGIFPQKNKKLPKK